MDFTRQRADVCAGVTLTEVILCYKEELWINFCEGLVVTCDKRVRYVRYGIWTLTAICEVTLCNSLKRKITSFQFNGSEILGNVPKNENERNDTGFIV